MNLSVLCCIYFSLFGTMCFPAKYEQNLRDNTMNLKQGKSMYRLLHGNINIELWFYNSIPGASMNVHKGHIDIQREKPRTLL